MCNFVSVRNTEVSIQRADNFTYLAKLLVLLLLLILLLFYYYYYYYYYYPHFYIFAIIPSFSQFESSV